MALHDKQVSLVKGEKRVVFGIDGGQDAKFEISEDRYNHRNGIIQPLYVEFEGNTISYSLKAY